MDDAKSTRVSRRGLLERPGRTHSARIRDDRWPGGGKPHFASVVGCSVSGKSMSDANHSELSDTFEALADARRRLAEAPVDVVVANHAMGLFELGAIHLSGEPPNLEASALAIDALACLVEGIDERLGENAPVLRDALANIRLAFVQIKGTLET